MKAASCMSLLLALSVGACDRDVPTVAFCKVLESKASYRDREFKTEILVIASENGGVAGGLGCPSAAIAFSDSRFADSPELEKLEANIGEAHRLQRAALSDMAAVQPFPVKGVVAEVTARVVAWPARPGMYMLKVLTAFDSRIVDVPREWYSTPDLPRESGDIR